MGKIIVTALVFTLMGFAARAGEIVAAKGAAGTQAQKACPTTKDEDVTFKKENAIRVLPKKKSYTEGLFFKDGFLYESNGAYGKSNIMRIDAKTGEAKELAQIDSKFFAEGLATDGKNAYQLTYKEGKVFKYELDDKKRELKKTGELDLPGESWGLAQYGKDALLLSDGSPTLRIVDPKDFKTKREIKVHTNKKDWKDINELEVVGNRILANVYGMDFIGVIDPTSGCMVGSLSLDFIDSSPELSSRDGAVCYNGKCNDWDFVANGIAYDKDKSELYITGKNWNKIFVFNYPPK